MTTDAERVIAAGVPVAIGGEEFRLIFDFESLEIIESEFGGLHPFTAAVNEAWDGPRMKVCRVGLRAGLAHLEDPKLNGPLAIRRLTAQLTGPGGIALAEKVAEAIAAAWNQAMPGAGGGKSGGKGSSRASGSHGSSSSDSPAKSSTKVREASAG